MHRMLKVTQVCICVCVGFPLNEQLYKMIVRRYSDENENMDFDNFIGCLVRLDAMCRECRRAQSATPLACDRQR